MQARIEIDISKDKAKVKFIGITNVDTNPTEKVLHEIEVEVVGRKMWPSATAAVLSSLKCITKTIESEAKRLGFPL